VVFVLKNRYSLNHYYLCWMRKKSMADLQRLSVEDSSNAAKIPVVVVLDNVRSMNNVGSVFRTCDGFAIEALYLCGHTPQPPHRDIAKTALGATDSVAWQHVADTASCVQALAAQGYICLAIEQAHGSVALQTYSAQKNCKYALVFGNEVEGVQQSVMDICTAALEIPQAGAKHSLNISVSAGVVMWHFYHQFLEDLG
jgi:23S rRNA (guanosine2251-2'-O)-methyltransferase